MTRCFVTASHGITGPALRRWVKDDTWAKPVCTHMAEVTEQARSRLEEIVFAFRNTPVAHFAV